MNWCSKRKEMDMLNLIKLMVAMALTSFSVNVSAYALADVGTKDALLAADTLKNSGSATEEAWIESVLGFDINYTQMSGGISEGSNWESVIGGSAGDYAFEFDIGFNPEYYLLKIGGGKGAGADETHYLYDNLESLQYAYVNLSDFGDDVKLENIGIISHIGSTGGGGGGGGNAPEPSMVGLLAIGLLGMAISRRKIRV